MLTTLKNILLALALTLSFVVANEIILAASSGASTTICVGNCPLGSWLMEGGTLSSCYGFRSRGGGENHYGIDINQAGTADCGAPALSPVTGKVRFAGWNSSGYGNLVIVIDNGGNAHYIAHLIDQPDVLTGETVNAGQPVGGVGNTGNSDGCHIHYEVRAGGTTGERVNPCCGFLDCSTVVGPSGRPGECSC